MSNAVVAFVILMLILIVYYFSKDKEPTLYERLGGIYVIAKVVDRFSERVLQNPQVGIASPNPYLKEWAKTRSDRLPGLKFMRTLWLCDVAGGPYTYVPTKSGRNYLGLERAHCPLRVTPTEFDVVAHELSITLDEFGVPPKEKQEVLAAFAAHKNEVTMCSAS